MALTDESGNGMVMPVAPLGNYGSSCGSWGNDGLFWIIILFLFAAMGGWGNGFGNSAGNATPYFVNNDVQRGFDQAALTSGINGISTGLCNGFAGVQQSLCNGFAQAEIANNARQMADMQQNFSVQSALQNCCCENRSSIADLKYTVATENCADRTQSAQNTRDIIDAIRGGDQMLMDKICALELQGVKNQLDDARRDNISLQNQLNMATLRESQTAQNAFIAQGLNQEVDALYNRLSNCPVPSIPVYGRSPIFNCNNGTQGCGCGVA